MGYKIPTAEEMEQSGEYDSYSSMMIAFDKLHVQAALEAAWENFEYVDGCDTHGVDVKQESILNAYPLNKIQ